MDAMLSVGIDIGTTTTQVIFSRLQAEDVASWFSAPKIEITEKTVLYKSPIHLTPLLDEALIDGGKVKELVADEFAKAGFSPADTSTGAVIITGESARKENARIVLENLSHFAGDFVVSTAGPDLESVIAGKGSGAQQYSINNACTVANLDIGGGTTNIVLFYHGDVLATGCYDIGGRLIKVQDGLLRWISPSAHLVAEDIGVTLRVGEPANADVLLNICRRMAGVLEEAVGLRPASALEQKLRTSGSSHLWLNRPVKALCFSGGVADCIVSPPDQPFCYGDIGVLLGIAIRQSNLSTALPVIRSDETIRATVIGAGTYTTTVSGSTISYNSDLFPMKNIPCLRLDREQEHLLFSGNEAILPDAIRWFRSQSDTDQLVLALEGRKNAGYEQLKRMSRNIAAAWEQSFPAGAPLLVALEQDIAKALGQMLEQAAPNRNIVCIDGVKLMAGDYLDMGKPLAGGLAIPVVVKTLLFG